MTSRKRFMDALDGLDSSEEEEVEEETKKKKRTLTMEDLEKCGYKERPSILLVPEPKEEDTGISEEWSDGRAHRKREEMREEKPEERELTRKAVTEDVDVMAEFAVKRMELAEKVRQERKQEQRRLARNRKLTFNQKEKAKRNAGQASGGKNFIQEEKRIGRNFGLYSGFDT